MLQFPSLAGVRWQLCVFPSNLSRKIQVSSRSSSLILHFARKKVCRVFHEDARLFLFVLAVRVAQATNDFPSLAREGVRSESTLSVVSDRHTNLSLRGSTVASLSPSGTAFPRLERNRRINKRQDRECKSIANGEGWGRLQLAAIERGRASIVRDNSYEVREYFGRGIYVHACAIFLLSIPPEFFPSLK